MNYQEIESSAHRFLASARDAMFFTGEGGRVFTAVSVGVQRASHEIFARLSRIIEGHLAPMDFFEAEHGEHAAHENLSVVSFAFHINPEIVKDNSGEETFPSVTWFEARQKFDFICTQFIEHMSGVFTGGKITVPSRSTRYRADLSKEVPLSNWSERHVAFACGLGSFGLHGALITHKGCTHRLISMIVDQSMEVYADPPDDPYFNCLHFRDGSCGACITRCPVRAIVPGRHIIERCYGHEWMTCRLKSKEIYGSEVAACGLCMCGVPCDTAEPV